MCSIFLHKNNYISAYSKSQYEAPKQLLQLRSEIKPLFPSDDSSDSDIYSLDSPLANQKLTLQYIEKDRRTIRPIRKMNPSSSSTSSGPPKQQYQAYDRSRKTAVPLMRTPSSGFSSSSSSENMFSALSISNDQRIQDIYDPAVEVDLDLFLLPDVRYKQPIGPPSISGSNRNVSAPMVRQMQQFQQKPVPQQYNDFSYANVKRSKGYTDYMPNGQITGLPGPSSVIPTMATATSTSSSSSVPLSPGSQRGGIRCQYCWESYVKMCQRAAKLDPIVNCDGPWNWHCLYDAQGRVACPRLWFTQLDRAGSDMIQQMTHHHNVRHAPV